MKTILITGVSSGLGRVMAEEALHRGHRVIGTVRQEEQRQAFQALTPDRAIGRLLDVTDTAAAQRTVREIEADLGGIDVLINNAGYGLRGMTEELDLHALREQFEVNLFAPVALIQAVLPAMRARRAGHIVNIVSQGAIITFPGLGAYHGSKFALLGMSDALAKEVRPLGLRVTAVLPGLYGTDWNRRSLETAGGAIPDYQPVLEGGEVQWGDAAALGRVVLDAIEMEEPPGHLLVGPSALRAVRERFAQWVAEIDRWEALSYAEGEG
jgi:NAD(P)-dependent dehydrogenase (short-subunit alcohol dehydrogenase family)